MFHDIDSVASSLVFAFTKVDPRVLGLGVEVAKEAIHKTIKNQIQVITNKLQGRSSIISSRIQSLFTKSSHDDPGKSSYDDPGMENEREEIKSMGAQVSVLNLILENYSRATIIDPLDDGDSIIQMENCISLCRAIDISLFNFNASNDERKKFIELASKEAAKCLESDKSKRFLPTFISALQNELAEYKENINEYRERIKMLDKAIIGELRPEDFVSFNKKIIKDHEVFVSKQKELIEKNRDKKISLAVKIKELRQKIEGIKNLPDSDEPYWSSSVNESNWMLGWTEKQFYYSGPPICKINQNCVKGYSGNYKGISYCDGWDHNKEEAFNEKYWEVKYISTLGAKAFAKVEIYVKAKHLPDNVELIDSYQKEIDGCERDITLLEEQICQVNNFIQECTTELAVIIENNNKESLRKEIEKLKLSIVGFEDRIKKLDRDIEQSKACLIETTAELHQNLPSYKILGKIIQGIGAYRNSVLFSTLISITLTTDEPTVDVSSSMEETVNTSSIPSQQTSMVDADTDTPHDFIDCVSQKVMRDPVLINSCGHSFDRSTLSRLKECPCDRIPISSHTSNLALKNIINSWLEARFTMPQQHIEMESLIVLKEKEREYSLMLERIRTKITHLTLSVTNNAVASSSNDLNVERGPVLFYARCNSHNINGRSTPTEANSRTHLLETSVRASFNKP